MQKCHKLVKKKLQKVTSFWKKGNKKLETSAKKFHRLMNKSDKSDKLVKRKSRRKLHTSEKKSQTYKKFDKK